MMVHPHNDLSILPEDHIIRRISFERHTVPDGNGRGRRLSTKAFSLSSSGSCGMSIGVKKDIEEKGLDPGAYGVSEKYPGSIEFMAKVPRALGLGVGREPTPEDPFHGEVWRPGSRNFTSQQKKAMLNGSQWLRQIQGVRIVRRR